MWNILSTVYPMEQHYAPDELSDAPQDLPEK
jgi:hypothetical protein